MKREEREREGQRGQKERQLVALFQKIGQARIATEHTHTHTHIMSRPSQISLGGRSRPMARLGGLAPTPHQCWPAARVVPCPNGPKRPPSPGGRGGELPARRPLAPALRHEAWPAGIRALRDPRR